MDHALELMKVKVNKLFEELHGEHRKCYAHYRMTPDTHTQFNKENNE